jgi:hypothetical protein
MSYKVFLSYSQKDSTVAKEIAQKLRTTKLVRVFLAAENLRPGHQIPSKVLSGIRDSDLLLVLWSRNSDRSHWVIYEIGIAFGARVKVLPLVLTKSVPLPDFIRHTDALWMFPKKTESLKTLMTLIDDEARKKESKRIKAIRQRLSQNKEDRYGDYDPESDVYEPDDEPYDG